MAEVFGVSRVADHDRIIVRAVVIIDGGGHKVGIRVVAVELIGR